MGRNDFPKAIPFGMTILALLLVGAGGVQGASAPEIGIQELRRNAPMYLNSDVSVIGVLKQVGPSYYRNPRFVLQDSNGRQVEVSAWLPLEIPPPPPGMEPPPGKRPLTMRDLLGKQVEVTGTVRSKAADEFGEHRLDARTGRVTGK